MYVAPLQTEHNVMHRPQQVVDPFLPPITPT